MAGEEPITDQLNAIADGQPGAMDRLMATVYPDLKAMAEQRLRSMFGPNTESLTIEPAALVNETFLRLIQQQAKFENRRHFFSIVTRLMMRILIDYQRKRQTAKRAPAGHRITLSVMAVDEDAGTSTPVGLEDLDAALQALDAVDSRKADIARMRVIWSMSHDQVAESLEVSRTTVVREWRFARSWLMRELKQAAARNGAAPGWES